MWFSPEQIEFMRQLQQEDLQATREAAEEERRKKAEEDLKTFDELFIDAKENCIVAGERLALRLIGVLDREAGKIIDQYPILNDYEVDTKRLIDLSFFIAFDKEVKKRKYVKDAMKEMRKSKKEAKENK